jgi:hypothetical protein
MQFKQNNSNRLRYNLFDIQYFYDKLQDIPLIYK